MAAWKQVVLQTALICPKLQVKTLPSRIGLFTVSRVPGLMLFMTTALFPAHHPHICRPRIIPARFYWDLLAATRVRTRTTQVTLLISMVILVSRQLSAKRSRSVLILWLIWC